MPATLPITVGSSDCDPGGFQARGVQAFDIDGTLLTWNGETWQALTSPQTRQMQALVSGAGKPSALAAIGNSIIYASGTFGLPEAVCALSGGKLWCVANAGKNGDTTRPTTGNGGTTGMTARFDSDVGVHKPGIVLAMEAVNNFGSTGPNVTVAMAVADMIEMAAKTKAWGGRFVCVGNPTYTTNPVGVEAYNTAYARAAEANGFEYFDPWQDGINPADGSFIDTTWGYADGIHPTTKHIRYAAQRLAAYLLSTGIKGGRVELLRFNTDTRNRVSNGLFLNSSGGVPTGWTQSGSGVTTSAIRAGTGDVLGNWWDITATSLSALSLWTGTFSFSGLAAGQMLRFSCRLNTSGFEANGSGAAPGQGRMESYLQVSWSGAGVTSRWFTSIGMDLTDGIAWAYIAVPAGAVGGTLQLVVAPRTGSVSGVLSIAQLDLRDVSTT